jgi:amino acid transporter
MGYDRSCGRLHDWPIHLPVAGDVARQLGSPGKCLALWIAAGILVLFGAFCYAELGAALPEAGGDYVYQSRGLSPACGFLYGWTSAIILKPGSAAIIAAGFSRLAAFLWALLCSIAVCVANQDGPQFPRFSGDAD